jgi:Protein of unknown function (DUF732)
MMFKIALAMSAVLLSTVACQSQQPHLDRKATFIAHVHTTGISNEDGDAGIAESGRGVCEMLAKGNSPGDVVDLILQNSKEKNHGVTPDEANSLVTYSHDDLCPGI